jgi:hypothetical protein
MSPTARRRTRKPRSSTPSTESSHAQGLAASRVAAVVAPWKWRTFPVYFAFSLGGFIGLYMGIVSEAIQNPAVSIVVFSLWAILLGFGLSRFTTRFLISRNWVKPRPARSK